MVTHPDINPIQQCFYFGEQTGTGLSFRVFPLLSLLVPQSSIKSLQQDARARIYAIFVDMMQPLISRDSNRDVSSQVSKVTLFFFC